MKLSRYQYAKRAPKEGRTGPDGFVYDSRTEMLRGIDLQLMERGGLIKGLQRQPQFNLQMMDVCIMAGNRVAVYTPDFLYWENDIRIIEDVKGYPDEHSKFRIRVFEALYGEKVRIVKKIKGIGWVTE